MPHTPSITNAALTRQLFAIAAVLLVCSLGWDMAGLDLSTMRSLGNADGFPLRHDWWLESILHDSVAKIARIPFIVLLINIWRPLPVLGLLAELPRRDRAALAINVLISALSVSLIKQASLTSCPWSLGEFGGTAEYVSHWAWGMPDGGGGRCFPGGHSTTAFCFAGIAIPFMADPSAARRRLGRWLLAGLLAGGVMLGGVQIVRGAHYPSHIFWAASLSWLVTCVVWSAWREWDRRATSRASAPVPAQRDRQQ